MYNTYKSGFLLGIRYDENGVSYNFISPEETEGSFRTGAIHIKVDPNIGLEETDKLYKKLRTIKDGNGAPLVTGHTTVDGEMLILNDDSRIAAETLAEMINDLIPDYEIMTSEVFAGFPEKEGYGYADSEQGAVDGKTYDEGINLLREETSRKLERELDRAEGRRVPKNDTGLVQGERSGNQEAEVASGRGLLGKTEEGTGLRGTGRITEQTNEGTQGDEGASSMPETREFRSFSGLTKDNYKEEGKRQVEAYDDLVNSSPVVKIKPNDELSSYHGDELLKKVREYCKAHYSVETERTDKDGNHIRKPIALENRYGEEIYVGGKLIDELEHQNADERAMRMIPYLKEILSGSYFLFNGDVLQNRHKKSAQTTRDYKQYACKVDYEGTPYYVRSTIRVDVNGKYYYDINFDNLEVIKKDSFELRDPARSAGAGTKNPSFSTNMLSLWRADVNTFRKVLGYTIRRKWSIV